MLTLLLTVLALATFMLGLLYPLTPSYGQPAIIDIIQFSLLPIFILLRQAIKVSGWPRISLMLLACSIGAISWEVVI